MFISGSLAMMAGVAVSLFSAMGASQRVFELMARPETRPETRPEAKRSRDSHASDQ